MSDTMKKFSEGKNAQVIPLSAIIRRLKRYKDHKNFPFMEKLPYVLSLMLDNEFKQNIQKIYLFGSYAYGKPHENSDLDFFVIIDDSISTYRKDVHFKMEDKLWDEQIVPNDLLVYNEGAYNKYKDMRGIERVVAKYGKLIYERN